VKKLVTIASLIFLLALGGMGFSQHQGGMMAPQGGTMDMTGQCPMMGMMNMMNQCASVTGGQQMGQMPNQCMAMMGGQPAAPGSQPQQKKEN